MQIYDFPQYSPEWWAIRARKLTGSNAQAIGNCGKGLETYTQKVMQDYYRLTRDENGYHSKDMDRGNDLEESACMAYSYDMGISTQKVGFVTHNDYVGCSPDRFANEDGLAECKCLDDKAHFALILGGKFESKYVWQCLMQMLICRKKWCDLFSYNPNYEKYLIVHRILPDKAKFIKLLAGFAMGEKMLKEIEVKMEVVKKLKGV